MSSIPGHLLRSPRSRQPAKIEDSTPQEKARYRREAARRARTTARATASAQRQENISLARRRAGETAISSRLDKIAARLSSEIARSTKDALRQTVRQRALAQQGSPPPQPTQPAAPAQRTSSRRGTASSRAPALGGSGSLSFSPKLGPLPRPGDYLR